MDTWDALRSRRNVRNYTDATVDPEQLERILEAGRRTPSARNSQPWDLVVVTDRARLEELSRCWRGAGHVARSAVTIAIVTAVETDPATIATVEYDLGQLTMTMMIAATDLGIGSAHASVEDQSIAHAVLAFPDGYRCAWLLALGHPADGPLEPITTLNRRPYDEVVHQETW